MEPKQTPATCNINSPPPNSRRRNLKDQTFQTPPPDPNPHPPPKPNPARPPKSVLFCLVLPRFISPHFLSPFTPYVRTPLNRTELITIKLRASHAHAADALSVDVVHVLGVVHRAAGEGGPVLDEVPVEAPLVVPVGLADHRHLQSNECNTRLPLPLPLRQTTREGTGA